MDFNMEWRIIVVTLLSRFPISVPALQNMKMGKYEVLRFQTRTFGARPNRQESLPAVEYAPRSPVPLTPDARFG